MAKRIGIYFYSRYGQTRKIAAFMADRFRSQGCEADVTELGRQPQTAVDPAVDALIVAAPVYARGFPASVERFVTEHRDLLLSRDSAFCSVCLTQTPHTSASRREAMGPVNAFLAKHNWSPKWIAVFPGALQYRDYSFLVRFVMKRISRSSGGPTDTSRNYEFTDWNEVSRLVTEVAQGRTGGEFSNETATGTAA